MPGPHPRLAKQATTTRQKPDHAHPSAAAGRFSKGTGKGTGRAAHGHGTESRPAMLERLERQGRVVPGTSILRKAGGSAPLERG